MTKHPDVPLYMIYFIICFALNANASFKRYQTISRQGPEESDYLNTLEENKVVLEVYYESLCPGSAYFFTKQLKPAVEALGSHLKVKMYPYGKAETKNYRGFFKFLCHHGPEECYGNKLHACAIDIIKNNTNAALYNSCLMKYTQKSEDRSADFTAALNLCGNIYEVSTQRVWNCARSRRGANLLKHFGEETQKLDIQYVPYILLDGSSGMQEQATEYLTATICHMLEYPPPVCEIYDTIL